VGYFKRLAEMSRSTFITTQHPCASTIPDMEHVEYFFSRGWIAQPKINGRKIQLHIESDGTVTSYTRHGTLHTMTIPPEVLEGLRRWYLPEDGKKNVLEGEFVPKQKKVYLFDVIVFNSKQLVSETYLERYKLLKKDFIYPFLVVLPVLNTKTLSSKDEIIEGIVFKLKIGKGFSDKFIIRCRKNGTL
jgi:ATP-dependent DNA ligase